MSAVNFSRNTEWHSKQRPGQATKKDLYGTNTRARLIPFKVITLCEVVHAILKGAVGYGSLHVQLEIVYFKKDEDYWAAA